MGLDRLASIAGLSAMRTSIFNQNRVAFVHGHHCTAMSIQVLNSIRSALPMPGSAAVSSTLGTLGKIPVSTPHSHEGRQDCPLCEEPIASPASVNLSERG